VSQPQTRRLASEAHLFTVVRCGFSLEG